MIIPAVLNIKKGGFIATPTFYCCYSACNSFLQCIYEILSWPLSQPGIYFFLHFGDDGDQFLVQF